MTKIEAINEILEAINQMPLEDTDVIDDIPVAKKIEKRLNRVTKEVLRRGWNFNKLTLELSPNTSDNIVIPDTFISVKATDETVDYSVRDGKLFDKDEFSFTFTDAVECVVVDEVAFDTIPFAYADLIVKTTALRAYIAIIGDANGVQNLMMDANNSKVEAERENARYTGVNVFETDIVTGLLDRETI